MDGDVSSPDNGKETERPTDATVRWRGYGYSRGTHPRALWLCDACGRRALDHDAQRDLDGRDDEADDDAIYDAHPCAVQRIGMVGAIDLERPHVWATSRRNGSITDLVYADRVDNVDFVVPAAAAHLLDPCIFDRLGDDLAGMPAASGCDAFFSRIGSVRGWMPLRGAHASQHRDLRDGTCVLVVCCDARNPMWGAVALVHFCREDSSMTWYGGDDSLARLIARWKSHPLRMQEPRFALDWVEWAAESYIDADRTAKDALVAAANSHYAKFLQRVVAEDYASSGKPWTDLLDEDEREAFFAPHAAVDDLLDRDDDYESGRQQRRRRRRRATRGRRRGR